MSHEVRKESYNIPLLSSSSHNTAWMNAYQEHHLSSTFRLPTAATEIPAPSNNVVLQSMHVAVSSSLQNTHGTNQLNSVNNSGQCLLPSIYQSPSPGMFHSPAPDAYNLNKPMLSRNSSWNSSHGSPASQQLHSTPKQFPDNAVFKTPDSAPRRSRHYSKDSSPASSSKPGSNPSNSPYTPSPRIIVKFQDIRGNGLQKSSVATSFSTPESPSDVMLHNISHTLRPNIKPCRSTIRKMDFQDEEKEPDVVEMVMKRTQRKRLSTDDAPNLDMKRSKTALFPDINSKCENKPPESLGDAIGSCQQVFSEQFSPLASSKMDGVTSMTLDRDRVNDYPQLSPFERKTPTTSAISVDFCPYSLSDLDPMPSYQDLNLNYGYPINQTPSELYANSYFRVCTPQIVTPRTPTAFPNYQVRSPASVQHYAEDPAMIMKKMQHIPANNNTAWSLPHESPSNVLPFDERKSIEYPSLVNPEWTAEYNHMRDANNNFAGSNLPGQRQFETPKYPPVFYNRPDVYNSLDVAHQHKAFTRQDPAPMYGFPHLLSPVQPKLTANPMIPNRYVTPTYSGHYSQDTHSNQNVSRSYDKPEYTQSQLQTPALPPMSSFSMFNPGPSQLPLQSILLQSLQGSNTSKPPEMSQSHTIEYKSNAPCNNTCDVSSTQGLSNSVSVVYMSQPGEHPGQKFAMMMKDKQPPVYAVLNQNHGGSWSNISDNWCNYEKADYLPPNVFPFQNSESSLNRENMLNLNQRMTYYNGYSSLNTTDPEFKRSNQESQFNPSQNSNTATLPSGYTNRIDSGYKSFISASEVHSQSTDNSEQSSNSSRCNSYYDSSQPSSPQDSNCSSSPPENTVFQPISPAQLSPLLAKITSASVIAPKVQSVNISKASEADCKSAFYGYQSENSVPCATSKSTGQFAHQPSPIPAIIQKILPAPSLASTDVCINIPGIPLYSVVMSTQANTNPVYSTILSGSQPLILNSGGTLIPSANLIQSSIQHASKTSNPVSSVKPQKKSEICQSPRVWNGTRMKNTTLVSSTTPGFIAELTCPKSRFFSLLGLDIGNYVFSEPDKKKRLSRIQFQFNMGKLTYEVPVESQQTQIGGIIKTTWHICLIDVHFTTIAAINAKKYELIFEVNASPVIRRKGFSQTLQVDELDPTDGQMFICPYHKLTLRPDVPQKVLDLMCLADRRFHSISRNPIIFDEFKVVKSIAPKPSSHSGTFLAKQIWKEPISCACSTGCLFSRCKCATAEQPCNARCKCVRMLQNCANPINQMLKNAMSLDIARKDNCLMANIFRIKDLESYLEKPVTFPCCDVTLPLRGFVPGVVSCPNPDCCSTYMYSWCSKKMMDTKKSPRHHCNTCCKCTDSHAVHCTLCNSCYTPTESERDCPCRIMHLLDDYNRRNVQKYNDEISTAARPENSIHMVSEFPKTSKPNKIINQSVMEDSETESDTEVRDGHYDASPHESTDLEKSSKYRNDVNVIPRGVCTEPMTPVRLHQHWMEMYLNSKPVVSNSCTAMNGKPVVSDSCTAMNSKPAVSNSCTAMNSKPAVSDSCSYTMMHGQIMTNSTILSPPQKSYAAKNFIFAPWYSGYRGSKKSGSSDENIDTQLINNETVDESAMIAKNLCSTSKTIMKNVPMFSTTVASENSNISMGENSGSNGSSLGSFGGSPGIIQLEKSFSTSLNFFSTLSPQAMHNLHQAQLALENHADLLEVSSTKMSAADRRSAQIEQHSPLNLCTPKSSPAGNREQYNSTDGISVNDMSYSPHWVKTSSNSTVVQDISDSWPPTRDSVGVLGTPLRTSSPSNN